MRAFMRMPRDETRLKNTPPRITTFTPRAITPRFFFACHYADARYAARFTCRRRFAIMIEYCCHTPDIASMRRTRAAMLHAMRECTQRCLHARLR